MFETSRDNIGPRLKNIHEEGELDLDSVAEDFSATATDCENHEVKHYNLDAIIAAGYRVNTKRAAAFRRRAAGAARDRAPRGYALNKKRLENAAFLDSSYTLTTATSSACLSRYPSFAFPSENSIRR